MSSLPVRRLLTMLAVSAVLWAGGAAPATAAPPQVVTEYGGTLEASGQTSTPSPAAPEDELEFEDVADWVKDNVVMILAVGGLVLVVVTWKIVSRAPKRRF